MFGPVLDDTVKFFKLQQERKNQFPSDRKDDETIKREIEENYGNVCEMVKDWIFEDMKKQVVKKEEEFDLPLLDRLDNDVKFEIIEFLPTFTKWKDFKLEEDYRCGIGFPHKIERDFRFSHRVDTDLVTFHKMRVLCKRFNRLMMSKIMNVKQLFISSNMNPMQCEYMATMLRMQRIYKDNNCNFPTQSIFLYEDLKIIRPEVATVRNPEIGSEIPQKGNLTIEEQNHSTPLFFRGFNTQTTPTAGEPIKLEEKNNGKIYTEGNDIWSVTLNHTNIMANNNKFYIIELFEKSEDEYL